MVTTERQRRNTNSGSGGNSSGGGDRAAAGRGAAVGVIPRAAQVLIPARGAPGGVIDPLAGMGGVPGGGMADPLSMLGPALAGLAAWVRRYRAHWAAREVLAAGRAGRSGAVGEPMAGHDGGDGFGGEGSREHTKPADFVDDDTVSLMVRPQERQGSDIKTAAAIRGQGHSRRRRRRRKPSNRRQRRRCRRAPAATRQVWCRCRTALR